ncbi:MAG: glycoside hydrolase family 127 protein [Bacteroidales bacterium]|jgi:DUF1680 family protein|nr:glycoside hydrolase family 127 protein [Bacteroidales bacterium]
MRQKFFIFLAGTLTPFFLFFVAGLSGCRQASKGKIAFAEAGQVEITDSFWSPKLKQWSTVTVNDILDKFEGKHPDLDDRHKHNAFVNFDDVAEGKRGTGRHAGFPWFDGLVYETFRGVSDLLTQHPDKETEKRIDGYIDRIYAAQQTDPDGYINTYTDLVEPGHRWGDNGGVLRFQHEVYNAGWLIEAGIHYYRATGKVKLLEAATRLANYMCDRMGPEPKKNIVPSHSGPEESMMKLYWLYRNSPDLKSKMSIPVNEDAYYSLAQFWIENRGNHCGYPLWLAWGNREAEKWIKEEKYRDARFGENARPSWGSYAQDSIPVFEQKTIEGHAVRATLLATGIATVALENHSPRYIQTVSKWWDNMVGKRMFVTGGVGAIHYDEKFGADYFLPTDAYLETCAAVGVGFFSQRMNELTGNGKYADELERALYNNVLTGISLSGDKYTYQNPLNAHHHSRWVWHDCPCCPPMFLKIVSALPEYIYASENDKLYINLFIGSNTEMELGNGCLVGVALQTNYPWDGKIAVNINPEKAKEFSLKIRIPGWAQGVENPYDLYRSDLKPDITLTVNGVPEKINTIDGYTEIRRIWKKGDQVELNLPVQPRIITANEQVKDLNNMLALASGPLIYCLEETDNPNLDNLTADTASPLELHYASDLLGGVNRITGTAIKDGEKVTITAIPYYAVGNRQKGSYKVWLPKNKKL